MDAQKHRLAKFGLTVPSEMEGGDDDHHQGKTLQIEYGAACACLVYVDFSWCTCSC